MTNAAAAANPSSGRSAFRAQFALVLVAQAAFAYGWSLYLLAPKYLATELGASVDQIGLVAGIGSAGGVLAIPLAAVGIDRIGRRLFFRLGSALLIALSLIYLAVDGVGFKLFVAQALVSAAYVLAFNGSATLVADLAPPERLSHAIGILGAVSPFMNAVATASGELVAEQFGWAVVFATGACAGGLALAVSLLVLEPERRSSTQRAEPNAAVAGSIAQLLTSTLLIGATFAAMFVFFQPFVLQRGAVNVRTFFVGFTAAAVLVRVTLGHLGDRYGHRRVSVLCCFLYALSSAAMVYIDVRALWLFGALFGVAHGLLYPTLNTLVLSSMPEQQRGRAMTFYNGAFNVGTAASSVGWGYLSERYGFPALFWTAAFVACAAGVVLLLRDQRTPT